MMPHVVITLLTICINAGSSFKFRDSKLLSASIRLDFPALLQREDSIYLDSAATAQKPQRVLDAMNQFYQTSYGNVHRGQGKFSDRATEQYEAARSRVAHFFHASSPREVVFTGGATSALNLIALSIDNFVAPGDEIVVTVMDHHSNILPWMALARRKGLVVKTVGIRDDFKVDLNELERVINKRTVIVSIPHISNVLGVTNPVETIVSFARRVGALVVLDACQSAPEKNVDVQRLGVDFMVASGHKMCGPTGIGVLFGRQNLLEALRPGIQGGGMVDIPPWMATDSPGASAAVCTSLPVNVEPTFLPVPHCLEAGTPPIAEAVGLAAACDYLDSVLLPRHSVGSNTSSSKSSASERHMRHCETTENHELSMKAISAHVAELSAYMYDELRSSVKDITIYGPANRIGNADIMHDHSPRDSGIVSFHVPGVHSLDLATRLASPGAGRGHSRKGVEEGHAVPCRSVSVRSGMHCASLLHRALRCPEGGTVRASVYIYNDKREVDYFVNAVNKAVHELKTK